MIKKIVHQNTLGNRRLYNAYMHSKIKSGLSKDFQEVGTELMGVIAKDYEDLKKVLTNNGFDCDDEYKLILYPIDDSYLIVKQDDNLVLEQDSFYTKIKKKLSPSYKREQTALQILLSDYLPEQKREISRQVKQREERILRESVESEKTKQHNAYLSKQCNFVKYRSDLLDLD